MAMKTAKARDGARRGAIWSVLIWIIFLAGALLLIYPALSEAWNSFRAARTAAGYEKTVDALSEEEIKRELELAEAYNRAHKRNTFSSKPFLNEPFVNDHPYKSLLGQSGGVMGFVVIPKLGVRLPIRHGTSAGTLESGAGHLKGTSLPVGGKSSHAVIVGHRGLPGAKLFTDLDRLRPGDGFYLEILGKEFDYEVDQVNTVRPSDVTPLAIIPGRDLVTLLTCTPYGQNTKRLLIRGHRVRLLSSSSKAASSSFGSASAGFTDMDMRMAGLIAAEIMLLVLVMIRLRQSRQKFGPKPRQRAIFRLPKIKKD